MAVYSMLTINGYDFKDYLPEDGIRLSPIERLSRSVVTLDGIDHRHWIGKEQIDVTLLDLPQSELVKVTNRLAPIDGVVQVTYRGRDGLYRENAEFYLTDFTAGVRKVYYDNLIYWSGISFTLEEK